MKRPSTSPSGAHSISGAPSIAHRQLSLFGAEPAPPTGVRTRSERALRREAPGREVRLALTQEQAEEQATDQMAAALALYLPPGKTLELRLTNNHYSMIAVRRKSDGYRLRLHQMFVGAEPRVVRALARYVVHNDRRASTLLGEYIEQHQHIIRQQTRRPRNLTVRTAGRHHDLQAIFDRLNVQWFGGVLEARITWGPVASQRQRRRSIKMGSFAVEDRVIRIHPALDQACVPDYFVSWIVFHEMLHGKHEIKRENGRRRFHTPEFLAEERQFPEFERACAWEKANLDRLLRP
ncbi:MAG TPA: hypothetical protein VGP64_07790 [Polyangia bacterium]